eukprot:gene13281-14650_t
MGLNTQKWRARIRAYDNGNFKFGQGQWPPKGNKWHKELCRVDACPRKAKFHKDIFGRVVTCVCGYHASCWETRTSPTSTQGTSGLPVDTPELARMSLFPKQQPNYAHRIPDGWRANIAPRDQAWIGKHVFVKKGVPSDPSQHWFHAPEIRGSKKPVAGEYFLRPMYLWIPRLAYVFSFKCCRCQHSLRYVACWNNTA